jgi:hypothetical protein
MTISTKDCKNFIDSISHIIDTSSKDKWKRIRKYKEDNLVLRDFENQDGRALTICEKDGKLSLYQLNSSPIAQAIDDGWGKKYLGREAKPEDISAFLAECIAADPEIVYDDQDTLKDASNPNSWTELWVINTLSSEDDLGLYYVDENEKPITLSQKNIKNIHVFRMPNYDTAYRISVFETEDKYLYLGNNDPD